MIKVSMRFVLLSALILTLVGLPAFSADKSSSASVELTRISFDASDHHELNVTQLSKPESRLTYDELGKLLSTATVQSEGMTTFDGTSITVNIPPQIVVSDAAPMLISTPDRGMTNATVNAPAVTVKRAATSLSAWLNGGALPTVQHQPLGRINVAAGAQSTKPVAKATTAASGRSITHGKTSAAFGSHRR